MRKPPPPQAFVTITLAEIEEHYLRGQSIERELRGHGLTPFLVLLLRSIALEPEAPFSQRTAALRVGAASVSTAMDRLEHAGLAERLSREEEASSDHRHVRARLTERGQALLDALQTLEIER